MQVEVAKMAVDRGWLTGKQVGIWEIKQGSNDRPLMCDMWPLKREGAKWRKVEISKESFLLLR
jgi:hypothetical protein